MTPDKKLITVDGPIADTNRPFGPTSSRIIYSVSLANGMIMTSPERFELAISPDYRPKQDDK